ARLGGRVEGAIAQLTGVVDTTVAGRVELDDVEIARTARPERHTRWAHPARTRGRPLDTVERAREDARRGRLTAATRTGEQIRVTDPSGVQRGTQRVGDMLLTHYLSERRRSILPVQSHGQRLPTRSD